MCGSYDRLLGEASNINEAWTVLYPHMNHFDEGFCITCPNLDDDPVFNNTCQDCEMFQSQMGYEYDYLYGFIHQHFKEF